MASDQISRSEPLKAFIPELEALISEVMEEWKLPGLAVAVVQNGQAAFVKAYGHRDLGMSRFLLKNAQQAFSVAEPMRPWRAVQGWG